MCLPPIAADATLMNTVSAVAGNRACFVVLNDLHARFASNKAKCSGYIGAEKRAKWLMRQISPKGILAKVDFVLSAGDLIHGESLSAITEELAAFERQLSKMPVPFYPCCGNHEIRQMEGDPKHERAYRRFIRGAAFDYSFMAGACEIIVLNNAGSFHISRERRNQRHKNLMRLLQAHPGVPKIVVCHIPLVAIREERVLRKSFGFLTYKCLESELLDVLDMYGEEVRLVVSGHLHLTGMVQRGKVRHLVASGAASFPHDFPIITVTPEALAVDIFTLPEEMHEPRTNLHGRPRYNYDFQDSTHPDIDTYLRGLPKERNFIIPL